MGDPAPTLSKPACASFNTMAARAPPTYFQFVPDEALRFAARLGPHALEDARRSLVDAYSRLHLALRQSCAFPGSRRAAAGTLANYSPKISNSSWPRGLHELSRRNLETRKAFSPILAPTPWVRHAFAWFEKRSPSGLRGGPAGARRFGLPRLVTAWAFRKRSARTGRHGPTLAELRDFVGTWKTR